MSTQSTSELSLIKVFINAILFQSTGPVASSIINGGNKRMFSAENPSLNKSNLLLMSVIE